MQKKCKETENTQRRELETEINDMGRTWKELQDSNIERLGVHWLRTYTPVGDGKAEVDHNV